MPSGSPTREQADLAEVLEMVLDKGIVINADIAVTVGQTELLGIEIRAAIASFETAAKYGLAFPSGTDMRRVEQASGRESLEGDAAEPIDLGFQSRSGGADTGDDGDSGSSSAAPGRRPTPTVTGGGSPDEPVEQTGGGGAGDGTDETGNNSEADETDGTDETVDGTDETVDGTDGAGEGDGEEGDG